MKKTLLILLLGLIGWSQQSYATCPLRRTIMVRQSDGTCLQIQKHGNGDYVFYTTTDGMTLVKSENGDFCYSRPSDEGFVSTGILAHEVQSRSVAEQKMLSVDGMDLEKAYLWMNRLSSMQRHVRGVSSGREDGLGTLGQPGSGIVKSIGSPTIPVIMIEFPDCSFMESTTQEKVGRMLNEKGYADERFCKGSVKDYFKSQSNGLFVPSFEVVAKVKASKSYRYYGENYSNGGIDKNVKELISEALFLASEEGVDFHKYAIDNGRVPLVSVYFAGPGEHSAFEKGCEDYLWAHFSERSFNINGVTVNSYFVGNEVLQDYEYDETIGAPVVKEKKFDGIGIFVHEFGHALGLPDFYSTNGVKDFITPDYWSVMDYGQYFYDGYAPIGYTAFERSALGWLDVQELEVPRYAELFAFSQEKKGATAYCIRNDANPKEYFLLENRQPDIWYPKLMGHGMLITHVDYNAANWAYNTVNNDPYHQRYQIVPADNEKNGYDEKGKAIWDSFKADLFPGLKNVVSFTDDTTPSSAVFTGVLLGKPLYKIKEDEGVVSFSFMDESLTGIDSDMEVTGSEKQQIYTLSGRCVGSYKNLLPGVYLLKCVDRVKKIYIN